MDSKPASNSQRVTTLPTDQYRSPRRASCQARTDGLDESAIETCLLMVRVGLRNHSPDQAKAAIDRAFEQPPPLTMRSDLVDMGLDPTIAGFLRTAGIESIGDLAGRTEEQLRLVPNIGDRNIEHIRAALTVAVRGGIET